MSAPATKIALCLVLHESLDFLSELFSSLKQQTRRPDRLVVCVNGPDDGAVDFIRNSGHEAELLERPENPGFSGGMNLCLKASADCDFVFLLNPDVKLAPNYIEELHRTLLEDEQAAGAQGLLVTPAKGDQKQVIDSAGFISQPWLRIVDRGAGSSNLSTFSEAESVLGICAAAALFRRSALMAVAEDGEIFDEDFWMYKEDQDLCLRLRAAGWRLIYQPGASAFHERGFAYRQRRRVNLELRRHSLKNRYLLLVKHWRWRQQLWTLPFVLGYELLILLTILLREPGTLKAYSMAAALMPRALAKRRALLGRERARAANAPDDRPAWVMSR